MIVSAAQTKPKKEDINGNLKDHHQFIQLAADHGAGLIVFPEMSITGYERELAGRLAFSQNDPRLDTLRELAVSKRMIIVAGAPIQQDSKLFIGSFIFSPDSSCRIYTKQFLHSGEENYFHSSFDFNPELVLGTEKISLAICADIDHPAHCRNAAAANSTMYVSSLFYTSKGIPKAHDLLSGYAKEYSMNVLMANYVGSSFDLEAGGGSGFWDNKGDLIVKMDASQEGLLLASLENDRWAGSIVTK